MTYEILNGDALLELPMLAARGVVVDACITDPPYGTTACAWDAVIPFEPMWANLKRLVKASGAIVLFGSQPFTSALVMSNPKMFKYQWVWNKKQAGHFLTAKLQPLRITEDIAVFSDGCPHYQPEMRKGALRIKGGSNRQPPTLNAFNFSYSSLSDDYYPTNILEFANCANKSGRLHNTEKPVELMRYLVRTYTNPGDTVLDFTMGSGTTGVACAIEHRNFIGIESDEHYFRVAEARIKRASGEWAEIPRPGRPQIETPLFAEVPA